MTDTSPAPQQQLPLVVETGDEHAVQPQADPADHREMSLGTKADSEHAAQPQVGHVGDRQASLGGGADGQQCVHTQDLVQASPISPDARDCNAGHERAARTRNSMLWAAYGDALGFISELVDRKGLERRTHGAPLDHLMDWERRVGGKWGVDVLLPAGSWSDDTQLRMAVSRSVGPHGFDVETFARIELPVWLSYALGGGRASKAAAKNLAKSRTLWYANAFPGWTAAGGNGAAMRIQPHVWASNDLDKGYMLKVIEDSVCTHGHPRAIVGACFHAATLAHCMMTGSVPDSSNCLDIAAEIGDAFELIEDHADLGPTWVGLWEQATGRQLRGEWLAVVDELRTAIVEAGANVDAADSLDVTYKGIVERLGLNVARQQGSGILTTVAAAALAAAASRAHDGVVTAANAVGTDTDTIATMAGALLGACDSSAPPPQNPLDSAYLVKEADRLVAVSQGKPVSRHTYPDILTWVAPQTQADALVSDHGSLVVEGLGPAERLDTGAMRTARQDFAWQWVRTSFGQTLLIKRRPEVKPIGAGNDLTPPPTPASAYPSRRRPEPRGRFRSNEGSRRTGSRTRIDDAIIEAKRNISDDEALGSVVRRVAREGTLGDFLNLMRVIRDDLRR